MPKVTAGDHRAEVHRPRDHSSPVKVRGYPSSENGNFQKCLLADKSRNVCHGTPIWSLRLRAGSPGFAKVILFGSTPTPRDLHEDLALPVNQPMRGSSPEALTAGPQWSDELE